MPISNEVLSTELKSLAVQVNKLESKLDVYATHFITAEVYEIKHRELELSVASLKNETESKMTTMSTRLDVAEKSHTARTWILATFSAAAGIILAFLIQFYLQHVGSK